MQNAEVWQKFLFVTEGIAELQRQYAVVRLVCFMCQSNDKTHKQRCQEAKNLTEQCVCFNYYLSLYLPTEFYYTFAGETTNQV